VKNRPSVQEIIDFAANLDTLCRRHNASCWFSTSRANSYDLTEVRKLPKSLLRGQSSWFEIVFDKPPLGYPNLRDWTIHHSDIKEVTPDLETVFVEKLLHATFTR
jgi:hypothetical protein